MKDIKGYEGKYFADEKGNIYSNRCRNGLRKLKPQIVNSGYAMVDLGLNGVIKRHLVHRLVALSYIDNPCNKDQINHKNGNKADNSVANLEWVTRSENQLHSIAIGLRHTKGEKNSQAKLNMNDVINILNDSRPYLELSAQYKVSISTISDIKRGYSWCHVTGLPNKKKNEQ